MSDQESYGLSREKSTREMEAPGLDYRPPRPARPHPIGLIGCGSVTEFHLAAYRRAGFRVVALCDCVEERAAERQRQYFPKARFYSDFRDLLKHPDIEVVDVATHPEVRISIVEAALEAGKHVLSQKPFALDLDVAERLVELAGRKGCRLAVNQNGRWAPYFSYMRHALHSDHIGSLHTADFFMHFDHNWTAGTAFDQIHHLLLYDFAVHFFDAVCAFFEPRQPDGVLSKLRRSESQKSIPPLLATSVVSFPDGMATLVFGGDTRFGQQDETVLVGSRGTLRSVGPGLNRKDVTLYTDTGHSSPQLEGTWFEQGFEGTMAELLCAVEENREPEHSARKNLTTLALTFAAVASADEGREIVPGHVRRLPGQ